MTDLQKDNLIEMLNSTNQDDYNLGLELLSHMHVDDRYYVYSKLEFMRYFQVRTELKDYKPHKSDTNDISTHWDYGTPKFK